MYKMGYLLAPRHYSAMTPTNRISVAISEDARRCVVFLGDQDGPSGTTRIRPKGTGFFIQGGNLLGGGSYLVTAGHIAKQLHPPFVIRLNKKGGGAGVWEIACPGDIEWQFHDDDTVDLAVAAVDTPDWANVTHISADHFARIDKMYEKNIGAGDPAYVVGLFHYLHGKEENRPVVFSGNVALLPENEAIPVDGKHVNGYLVQANAISGCSGAPVFVGRTIPVTVQDQNSPVLQGWVQGSIWLLGVWQSSWKVKGAEIVAVDHDAHTGDMAPLGMGVVVPVDRLLEILNKPDLQLAREGKANRHSHVEEATLDSLPPSTNEISRHKEDFTALLNAAVKKKPQAG